MITDSFRLFQKQILIILILLVIGWQTLPYSSHFIGAKCGIVISFYCIWLLKKKTEKLVNHAIQGKRMVSLGFLNRAAVVILGVILMYEYNHHMAMWTFATGILGGYFLFIINLMYHSHLAAKLEDAVRKKVHE